MIEVHKPGSRLVSVERTLVECFGMLCLMRNAGSIPASWHSQVDMVCNRLGVAVLDVMQERTERRDNNDEVDMVQRNVIQDTEEAQPGGSTD